MQRMFMPLHFITDGSNAIRLLLETVGGFGFGIVFIYWVCISSMIFCYPALAHNADLNKTFRFDMLEKIHRVKSIQVFFVI